MENKDLTKSFQYMTKAAHGDVLEQAKTDIENTKMAILKNRDDLPILDEKICNLTIDDLSKLSDEDLEKIFTKEDGTLIEVQNIYQDDVKIVRKEFLKFCLDGNKIIDDLDKEIENLNGELEEANQEIDNVANIDFIKVMRDDLEKKLNDLLKVDSSHMNKLEKKKYLKKIEAYKKTLCVLDNSFSLNNIYENYVKIGTESTLRDYHDKDNSLRFYKKYKSFNKFYDIKTDLTRFPNLEKRFLSEKYHKYPNLFLFSVIKYYAYKPTYSFEKFDSAWLVQFNLNIYKLFANKIEENMKKEFIKNIERVLDLFIKE